MSRVPFRLAGHKAVDGDRSFFAVCNGVHHRFRSGRDVADCKYFIHTGFHSRRVYRYQSAADLQLQRLTQEGEVGFLAYRHEDGTAVKCGSFVFIVRWGKMTQLIEDGGAAF